VIKVVAPPQNGQPPRVFLGLSDGNLDRLRAGQPIRLDVDQCAMLGLGQRELVIYWGADEIAMTWELEKHGLIEAGATARLRAEVAKWAEGTA
jgi:hypothetical protein